MKTNTVLLFVAVCFMLIFALWLSAALGSANVSLDTVFQVLGLRRFGIESETLERAAVFIVWDLRLPRGILAIAVGGGLAIAGVAMQSVTQNVMADPYILGVSSGALAFVSVGYFIGGVFLQNPAIIPAMAFSGAVFSMLLVYAIGGFGKSGGNVRLILSGMAVSITLNAIAQFFIVSAPDDVRIRGILSWMMGTLASARWGNIALPLTASILACGFFFYNARSFDLMALGDETAIGLGTNVKKVKRNAIIAVSFVTAIAVSSAGLIGMVGFVIPHIVRFLIGTEHRKLFPLAFIVGGVFLLLMDIMARVVLAPREVPIGVFTALCGGPFFVWLIKRKLKNSA